MSLTPATAKLLSIALLLMGLTEIASASWSEGQVWYDGVGERTGIREVCIGGSSCYQVREAPTEDPTPEPEAPAQYQSPGQFCGEGQQWQGTLADGRCVSTEPEKKRGPEKKPADDEAARRRAACIAAVRQASSSCQSARSTADTSCDPNSDQQLAALNNERGQLIRDMQNDSTKQAACQRNASYQQRLSSAVQAFQGRCQQQIPSCTSACRQVPQRANGCADDPSVRQMVANAQSADSHCAGTLQTKANQAGEQHQGQTTTAEASRQCSTSSAASAATPQTPDAAPDQLDRVTTGTGTNDLSSGTGPIALTDDDRDAGATTITDGQTTRRDSGLGSELGQPRGTAFDHLVNLPTRQDHARAYAGGSVGGSFAGTPGLAGTGDATLTDEERRQLRAKIFAEGASAAGTKARRPWGPRPPTPLPLMNKIDSRTPASSASSLPDFNSFRPDLPRHLRRAAYLSSLGIHGEDVNFFQKVHERYVQVEPTLIFDSIADGTGATGLQRMPSGFKALLLLTSSSTASARLPPADEIITTTDDVRSTDCGPGEVHVPAPGGNSYCQAIEAPQCFCPPAPGDQACMAYCGLGDAQDQDKGRGGGGDDDREAATDEAARRRAEEAARRRAACIANVERAAGSCESAKSAASRSCDPNSDPAIRAAEDEGRQVNALMSQDATAQNACRRHVAYQQQLGTAISGFQSRCQQGIPSCSSTCQQVPSTATADCANDSRVRQMVATAQAAQAHCSSTLQQVSNQAAQQMRAQAAAGQPTQCSATQASATPQPGTGQSSAAPDELDRVQGQTGAADLGGMATTSATSPPQTMPDDSIGDAGYGGARSDQGGQVGSEMNAPRGNIPQPGDLVSLPTRQNRMVAGVSGGGFANSGSMPGPALDQRRLSDEERERLRKKIFEGDGTVSKGTGGSARRRFASPPAGPRPGFGVSDSTSLSHSARPSGSGLPDLNRFRPQARSRTDAFRRRAAGLASLGIHGPDANMFSKVNERYRALEHTLETDSAFASKTSAPTPVPTKTSTADVPG